MNEKLKEIMIQSGTHKYISEECQHRIEVIAELIVRECADIASINAHQYETPGTYVLKHFGVEE